MTWRQALSLFCGLEARVVEGMFEQSSFYRATVDVKDAPATAEEIGLDHEF